MMTPQHRASNAQKMILIVLDEGWQLRREAKRGWCLYRPDWDRAIASVSDRNVREMTDARWLTPGGAESAPDVPAAKQLTPLGRAYAIELARSGWGRNEAWKQRHLAEQAPPPFDLRIAA